MIKDWEIRAEIRILHCSSGGWWGRFTPILSTECATDFEMSERNEFH